MRDDGSGTTTAKPAARDGFTAVHALWIGLFLAVAVGLAFSASSYRLFQLTMVVVYAVAVLGMTILTGYNGQISLGHGAFFAIGSYATAILMANYDWPYWATIPVAAVASALVGFLIGFPALRLGGLYLALTTFALAVAVPQILKVNALSALTGGVQGLTMDKAEAPFGLPLTGDQWIYLFSLGVGCVVFLLAWNLTRGRTGRAMMAVREQSVAAEAMGVEPRRGENPHLRGQRHDHRHRRRAQFDRGAVRGPRQLQLLPLHHFVRWAGGRRRRFRSPVRCSAAPSSSSCRTSPTTSPRPRPERSTG